MWVGRGEALSFSQWESQGRSRNRSNYRPRSPRDPALSSKGLDPEAAEDA